MTDDDQDAASLRRSIFELGGTALLLGAWMGGLYWFTGLPDLARVPAWPGWEPFARMASSRTAPLDGVLQVAILVQWAIAAGLSAWLLISLLLELLLAVAEQGPARGSAWLRGARATLRAASFPLVHQMVVTLFALQLVVRGPNLAYAQAITTEQTVAPSQAQAAAAGDPQGGERAETIWHTVQRGETLWGLAERYYGNGAEYERIVEGNVGRPMAGGRTFSPAGVIRPGDLLNIPLPSMAIEEHDGQRYYVVEPGDTLDGLAARLLGDPARSPEIFELNAGIAQLGSRGPVLTDPNLIWPGLRLRLPLDGDTAEPAADEPPAEAAPTPAVAPMMGVAPDRQDHAAAQAAPTMSIPPTVVVTVPATPAASETPPPAATPAIQSPEQVRPEPGHLISPEAAALGAAGLAAAALAAGYLRVYKRRPGRDPAGPESEVRIEDGFAETDPVEHLARRLARSSEPEAAIASLLGQAYAAIFDEQLQPEARREASEGISVAATRHGRTSTTLVLSAPVAARPHLVHCMRAAAERAFGEQVDVDGQVGQDGDVLVRVTWDPRRPIAGHLLELVNASAVSSAWPAPCLVPALVLHDRQHLAINWHTVRNVLVAAPTGQGAEVPLTALVAVLASVLAPEDLGLVVIARPHTLPDEVCVFPHGLMDAVDPGDPEAVRLALESVKLEVDRRRETGSTAEADLVVVVRELGDLEPDALQTLAAIAATGPDYGVRLLGASERPVAELLGGCVFFDQLCTRLVLQAATEEDSVALLGMPGAEDLSAGGLALLRLEGRLPVQGWTRCVSADRLARLVHMMGTRAPAVPADIDVPATVGEPDDAAPTAPIDEDVDESQELDDGGPFDESGSAPTPTLPQKESARPAAAPAWASSLLLSLQSAPIRVRCFGACEAWYGGRLLKIARPELLLLLAVHPISGIQSELLADMLWNEPKEDPDTALRKPRFKLRRQLHRLVPEVTADPVPGSATKGEKVVALDKAVVSSDAHEFAELLNCVEKQRLEPAEAIEAYEAALSLYRGDLLDSPDMPNYRWMYDVEPQVALTLRSDFRLRHKEARLRLAELLANGPETGLARAEELYSGLCAEDLEDERLWTALFRIHERTGSSLGLESAVRRFRGALIELGVTEVTDIDSVPLPSNLARILKDIRSRISGGAAPVSG